MEAGSREAWKLQDIRSMHAGAEWGFTAFAKRFRNGCPTPGAGVTAVRWRAHVWGCLGRLTLIPRLAWVGAVAPPSGGGTLAGGSAPVQQSPSPGVGVRRGWETPGQVCLCLGLAEAPGGVDVALGCRVRASGRVPGHRCLSLCLLSPGEVPGAQDWLDAGEWLASGLPWWLLCGWPQDGKEGVCARLQWAPAAWHPCFPAGGIVFTVNGGLCWC